MRAILLAALLALAGCQAGEPILWGTVVAVQEKDPAADLEEIARSYDHPLVPEVSWKIVVRLDDGAEVVVVHNDSRRHAPGERVRLLKGDDSVLLL